MDFNLGSHQFHFVCPQISVQNVSIGNPDNHMLLALLNMNMRRLMLLRFSPLTGLLS